MNKKVLVVFDFLEAGGGTRAVINIAKALSKEATVDILTGHSEEPGSNVFLSEAQASCNICYTFPIQFHSGEFSTLLQCVWQIFKLVLKKRIDLRSYDVICLNLTKSSVPFLIFQPLIPAKLFYIFHGLNKFERSSQYPSSDVNKWPWLSKMKFYSATAFFHFLQCQILNKCAEVICFSKYSQQLIKEAGIDRKTHCIYPPVYFTTSPKPRKRKSFGLRDDSFIILLTSRIEPRKGIHLVIPAAENICRDFPNVQFLVLGANYNSSYFSQVFLSLRNSTITGRFVFLGPSSHQHVAELLQMSDLLLMPSVDFETLGFSTLEALFYGIPTIGFKSGATTELLTRINPQLVAQPKSSKGLEKGIRWFMSRTPQQRKELSETSRRTVRDLFTANHFVSEFMKLM
jgi:glycosyltransferase involved in cell wall biosynthesis